MPISWRESPGLNQLDARQWSRRTPGRPLHNDRQHGMLDIRPNVATTR
jgi:hypothetical protein